MSSKSSKSSKTNDGLDGTQGLVWLCGGTSLKQARSKTADEWDAIVTQRVRKDREIQAAKGAAREAARAAAKAVKAAKAAKAAKDEKKDAKSQTKTAATPPAKLEKKSAEKVYKSATDKLYDGQHPLTAQFFRLIGIDTPRIKAKAEAKAEIKAQRQTKDKGKETDANIWKQEESLDGEKSSLPVDRDTELIDAAKSSTESASEQLAPDTDEKKGDISQVAAQDTADALDVQADSAQELEEPASESKTNDDVDGQMPSEDIAGAPAEKDGFVQGKDEASGDLKEDKAEDPTNADGVQNKNEDVPTEPEEAPAGQDVKNGQDISTADDKQVPGLTPEEDATMKPISSASSCSVKDQSQTAEADLTTQQVKQVPGETPVTTIEEVKSAAEELPPDRDETQQTKKEGNAAGNEREPEQTSDTIPEPALPARDAVNETLLLDNAVPGTFPIADESSALFDGVPLMAPTTRSKTASHVSKAASQAQALYNPEAEAPATKSKKSSRASSQHSSSLAPEAVPLPLSIPANTSSKPALNHAAIAEGVEEEELRKALDIIRQAKAQNPMLYKSVRSASRASSSTVRSTFSEVPLDKKDVDRWLQSIPEGVPLPESSHGSQGSSRHRSAVASVRSSTAVKSKSKDAPAANNLGVAG